MRKKAIWLLLALAVVISAFLIAPKIVWAGESESNKPIWGEMKAVPPSENVLGSIVTIQVKVFWDKDKIEFDHHQIPQNINLFPLTIRSAGHSAERSGKYLVDVWEFETQSLVGVPPMELQIPSFSFRYKKKGLNYYSYFSVPSALVSFTALTRDGSRPDSVLKDLSFGPPKNILAFFLTSLSTAFILTGAVILFIFRRKLVKKKQEAQKSQPPDEFLTRYELLRLAFNQGESGLSVLHKLYLLLRAFYRERREMRLGMDWTESLSKTEKTLVKELQALYQEDSISKAHTRELFKGAKKIFQEGGG